MGLSTIRLQEIVAVTCCLPRLQPTSLPHNQAALHLDVRLLGSQNKAQGLATQVSSAMQMVEGSIGFYGLALQVHLVC